MVRNYVTVTLCIHSAVNGKLFWLFRTPADCRRCESDSWRAPCYRPRPATCKTAEYRPTAPCGSRGCNVPISICWMRHCIKCLLACLTSPLTFFITCSLSYLSISLRIGPFRFQARLAGCRIPDFSYLCYFCVVVCYECMFDLIVLDLIFICNGLVCIFLCFFVLA